MGGCDWWNLPGAGGGRGLEPFNDVESGARYPPEEKGKPKPKKKRSARAKAHAAAVRRKKARDAKRRTKR